MLLQSILIWRHYACGAVAVAAGDRCSSACEWFKACEDPATSMQQFSDPGEFVELDVALSNAGDRCTKDSDVGLQLQRLGKHMWPNTFMGRQTVWFICQQQRSLSEQGPYPLEGFQGDPVSW